MAAAAVSITSKHQEPGGDRSVSGTIVLYFFLGKTLEIESFPDVA